MALVPLVFVGLTHGRVVVAMKVARCIQTILVTAIPVEWLEELFLVCGKGSEPKNKEKC